MRACINLNANKSNLKNPKGFEHCFKQTLTDDAKLFSRKAFFTIRFKMCTISSFNSILKYTRYLIFKNIYMKRLCHICVNL